MANKKQFYAIECKIASGLIRYFCYYKILCYHEYRLVKKKNEAIFYNKEELDIAKVAIKEIRGIEGIESYKIVKA